MNPKNNLIFLKGEDKTEAIESCSYSNGKYRIWFKNTTQPYEYGYHNLEWYKNPEQLNLQNIKIYSKGRQSLHVESVLKFQDFYRVFYGNSFNKLYHKNEIDIYESCLDNQKSRDILQYFKELSMYISLKTDEGMSLMTKKYENITFVYKKSALATYLNHGENPIRLHQNDNLIFPFGCNLSQKTAVKNAMNYSVSVIEGPPGTGKTQTILNIIANILMENKTVAVVSNNNAATLNILEKLQKNNLGFVAAYLGNKENKNEFIENGQSLQINLPHTNSERFSELQSEINDLNSEIDNMLQLRNELALKDQMINELSLEKKHYEEYFEETYSNDENVKLRKRLSSSKLLKLWIKCEAVTDKPGQHKFSKLQRIYNSFTYGIGDYRFFSQPLEHIVPTIQKMYYSKKLKELQSEYNRLTNFLKSYNFENKLDKLTKLSKEVLEIKMGVKYEGKVRPRFKIDDLWKNSNSVLNEYPVILSTTHSVRSSLNEDIIYDYVIVDEASQVDLLTGVLAMSCAKNVVIVGDHMQLPNVVSKQDYKLACDIGEQFALENCYRYEKHSLLSSIISRLDDAPKVLLKEHYRCHPKIIQFCNQKFYRNQLIIMTEDKGEEDVLKVYKTVAGNHARGHFNQRQIDEIKQNVLPELIGNQSDYEVGIIAPYRNQKAKLGDVIDINTVDIDTVHKFQGREKDNIIITTVDNEITEFTDNPNLLNVAISRAKSKIRLVISDSDANMNTNIGDFIRYIQYNDFEIVGGEIYSVFDLLYKEYNQLRRKILQKVKHVSEYDSENLLYILLTDILQEEAFSQLDIIVHQPLNMMIKNPQKLDEDEVKYAMNLATHIDFLIYRKVDKSPLLAIEVDGYSFHKEGTEQFIRDRMKDRILEKYKIPYLRLSTTGSCEKDLIVAKLNEVLGKPMI